MLSELYPVTVNMRQQHFVGMAAFIAVRRDNHNENMIDKILQIYRYTNAQKRFEYEYMGIKSPWEDGQ